jgi:uncharacterized protein YjgD (DUF1641 family)
MGTLGKADINQMCFFFDGTAKSYPAFKEAMIKWADSQEFPWMIRGGNVICAMFQEANAQAAKSTGSSSSMGTIWMDIQGKAYNQDVVKKEFVNAKILVSFALSLRKNRKEVLGAHFSDPEKQKCTEDELVEMHAHLDTEYFTQVNRDVARALHNAVFSSEAKTAEPVAITKLRPILKDPDVAKILADEQLGTEALWVEQPWLMPAVQMWGKIAYRFEGMTEMINGRFMADLGDLLNSATGDARTRKTLYEIDLEFEKMLDCLLKNFNTLKSAAPFLRASLRQATINKLSKVGKDKEAWKKANNYLTELLDDDHMLTLAETDIAMKRAEQYLGRNEGAGSDAKDDVKVAFAAGVDDSTPQDTRLTVMEAENAEMKAQLKVLQAKLSGDKPGTNRNRVGNPVDKKLVPVCSSCGKRGHIKDDCWDALDAEKEKIDAAIAKREKKKAEIAKRKPTQKEARAYVAACNKASAATAAAAEDSEYSLPRVSFHGSRLELPATTHVALNAVLDQEFVPNTPGAVLDSAAMVNILQGARGSGTRVRLMGITGDSSEAEIADAVFPVVTKDKKQYLIRIRGNNIIAKKATNSILSLAVLLKARYDVQFRAGTESDPDDGGTLVTPDGKEIALSFKDNMWKLPMWSKPRRDNMQARTGNRFASLPCHDLVPPTSVQEALETEYPGDVVDIVAQQAGVSFSVVSPTLDAYHGDVVDAILALEYGPAAAAAAPTTTQKRCYLSHEGGDSINCSIAPQLL